MCVKRDPFTGFIEGVNAGGQAVEPMTAQPPTVDVEVFVTIPGEAAYRSKLIRLHRDLFETDPDRAWQMLTEAARQRIERVRADHRGEAA